MAGAGLISRRIMSLITHLVVFYVENKYKTLKSYLCYRFVNLYRGVGRLGGGTGTSVYLKSGPGRDPGRHGLQCLKFAASTKNLWPGAVAVTVTVTGTEAHTPARVTVTATRPGGSHSRAAAAAQLVTA